MAEDSFMSQLMGGDSGGAYKGERSINGSIDFTDSTTSGMVMLREGTYINPTTVKSVVLFDMITSSGTTTTNTLMFGLGLKKYLGTPAKSATIPFVLGSVGFAMMSSDAANSTTSTGFSYQGGGGFSQFVNESVSMDLDLQYYGNSFSGVTSNGMRLNLGATIRF